MASDKQRVFVSILPQRYFVKQVGGHLVDVSVMVMPGASPATYEPTSSQMTKLNKSAAYFSIGVPFEKTWLPRISSINPDMPIVPTDQGIDKQPMAAHEHLPGHEDRDKHLHKHKNDEGHDHNGIQKHQGIPDPHIWLAPDLVKTQAHNILDGLVKIDPSHKAKYNKNLNIFLKKIDKIDAEIRDIFKDIPEKNRSFMVFHPAWGYFAQQYDLNQVPVESGGTEPSPKELAKIIDHGRKHDISVIFVQPQFSNKSAQVIAREMDAQVIEIDPLAENWSKNLLHVARELKQALN